jgi:hypothetical protein
MNEGSMSFQKFSGGCRPLSLLAGIPKDGSGAAAGGGESPFGRFFI